MHGALCVNLCRRATCESRADAEPWGAAAWPPRAELKYGFAPAGSGLRPLIELPFERIGKGL